MLYPRNRGLGRKECETLTTGNREFDYWISRNNVRLKKVVGGVMLRPQPGYHFDRDGRRFLCMTAPRVDKKLWERCKQCEVRRNDA